MKHAYLTLGIVCCAAGLAFAQFKPAHIPEKATWFAQLDAKALRESAVAGLVLQLLDDNALRQLAGIHAATGLNLTNDIDTVVLFGKGNPQANAVLSLYGRFDVNRIATILGMGNEFQNRAIGNRNLLSWTDNGQRNNLCFIDPTHAVLSRDETEAVEAVKQVAGGTANATLAKTLTPVSNRIIAFQLNNMEDFVAENQQLVILKGTDSLILELSVKPGEGGEKDGIDGTIALSAGNLEQATQLHLVLLGLQAFLTLQAKENPQLAMLAQQVKIDLQGQLITLRMNLSHQVLKQLVDAQIANRQPPVP